ncbi:hypothetical protein NP233_g11619 [Leucocoprinus birnbaumii]|uniref:Golgi apparatus membrane protein TVP38 n=1 Tax=Leucocoprinus birnbaumii TaxID=56174 RepID=A0AAD5VJR8_9AGAR|nr:hypothetical protein NP233_g11619 [Leucocoprinus birnbaumii]
MKELGKQGAIDWKAMYNWRFWIRREWLWYYVILVVILVLTALMTIFHKQIVDWLTPVTKWLHGLSFGWIVPIAILFVISFPPLFGHEIVAILCGLVWGMWVGFGIVAAGTFLGEVGNFYAFKYCCRSRGEKLERTNISYACLAEVVRVGGFKIALIARLSAIPGHFTTAIFSTCGMGIIVFSIAAILSMPKQFITVYLGVLLEQSAEGTTDTKSRIISDVVLAITVLITAGACWYILHEMNKVKPTVIYNRRKARQAKLERQGSTPSPVPSSSGHGHPAAYNPLKRSDYGYDHSNNSDSEIPLTAQATPIGYNNAAPTPGFPRVTHFQDSSEESSSSAYDPTPSLHAPKPHRVGQPMPPVDFDEDLTNARPVQHSYDPLSGGARQGSYPLAIHNERMTPSPNESVNTIQPIPPPPSHSAEMPYAAYNTPTNYPPPNSPPRNYSRPTPPPQTLSPPPPRFQQNPSSLQQRQQYPAPAHPPPPSQMQNPFEPTSTNSRHGQEETYDSFYTAHSASPEPMTVQDRVGPRDTELTGVTRPTQTQQGRGQGQDPPPDYSFPGLA